MKSVVTHLKVSESQVVGGGFEETGGNRGSWFIAALLEKALTRRRRSNRSGQKLPIDECRRLEVFEDRHSGLVAVLERDPVEEQGKGLQKHHSMHPHLGYVELKGGNLEAAVQS